MRILDEVKCVSIFPEIVGNHHNQQPRGIGRIFRGGGGGGGVS